MKQTLYKTKALAALAVATLFAGGMEAALPKGEVSAATSESAAVRSEKIVVYINDRFAPADFRSEQVREDLLRNAFYDAARRSKWLGEYRFEYNTTPEEPKAGSIEFNVLHWRRSHAGMYQFTASASYWNADGEKVSLGKFDGNRTSIAVFNRWDIGEQFAGSAEDAFRGALRKLQEMELES